MTTSRLHALLVGVDAYDGPGLHELRGARNDVRVIARFLHDEMGVPAGQIHVLEDAAATRRAIRDGLRQHLFEAARRSVPSRKAPAMLWFHFSGNGSRRDTDDGRTIETLVPFDGRREQGWDIEDWELGQWIEDGIGELGDRAFMTVSLDCCHAGSGTRGAGERSCLPDPRSRPPEVCPPASRGLGNPAGWLLRPAHVLLAACRREQKAVEHVSIEGDTIRHHGALSFFLVEALGCMPRTRPWTYRELRWRIGESIMRRYEQSPQCEGDRDRLVFDGIRAERPPALRVTECDGDDRWIDGGIVHGLAEGALLQTCDAPDRDDPDAGDREAPGTLRVRHAGPVRSVCRIESGLVPLHARVRRIEQAAWIPRIQVGLTVSSPDLRADFAQRLAAADLAPHVQIFEPTRGAALQIRQRGDGSVHLERAGQSLFHVVPDPARIDDTVDTLACAVLHTCRFDNVCDLHGRAPRGPLHLAITATARALVPDSRSRLTTQPLPERYDDALGSVFEVSDEQPLVIEIENRYSQPLHLAVLALGSDRSIGLLYPMVRGTNDALDPGDKVRLGFSPDHDEQFFVWPPPRCDHSREIIQIFAALDEFECELLEQPAFTRLSIAPTSRALSRRSARSILGRLFERASTDAASRRALDPELDPDAWTSARIVFHCQRAL